ncbi:DUF559 domain-containing protein [Pseudofulvibacter geojedonensis]|uniref:DUF559 domain-containing protein n=1 Tax=Pseudofulvibacter geojedonensis TaxID=1123758 RepID=A0ABW3I3D4_9FLAO
MKNQIKKARELRQQQTKAECKLWQILRNRKVFDLKFRRQHPIKSFIVDFCCLSHQLIIELDGETHNNSFRQNYDYKRTKILEKLGYVILRFDNKLVFENPDIIISCIKKHIEEPLTPTLSHGRGSRVIVSTKILTQEQKRLLKNISLIEYDAISIERVQFNPITKPVKNAIITSKNSAQVIIDNNIVIENVFCVGEKTKQILLDSNYSVIRVSKNALELANYLVNNFEGEEFIFFCGNKRREELPSLLSKNNISFKEVIVYETKLQAKKINETFNGVLFFSPSGVESFTLENDLKNITAFCIGNTTAQEAKEHTDSILIAKETTIESVLEIVNAFF